MLKQLYRWPFDWFEGWSMGGSDRIVVNSNFTKSVVQDLFGRDRLGELRVVYPCVNTQGENSEEKDRKPLWGGKGLLLSINRFERKKDVGLAIRAYQRLSQDIRRSNRLVIAGKICQVTKKFNADTLLQGVMIPEYLKMSSITENSNL